MWPGWLRSWGRRTASSRASRVWSRSSTQRRLILALAALLAGFVAAMATQVSGLRAMESMFQEMGEHDEQMRLALELEDAVRDEYTHESRHARGESVPERLREEVRQRAEELLHMLEQQLDEPETLASLRRIQSSRIALHTILREEVRSAMLADDETRRRAQDRAHSLVSNIEGDVDRLFGLLQQSVISSRQELVLMERSALRWLTAVLLLAPLLAAGAAFYLSRAVAMPLARLSRGTAALAAGDLETRFEVNTPGEFSALAADLNAMTDSLRQHQSRLVESEKLAGIGRLAAGIAHELNNPLQVMIGYLSLYRDLPDEQLSRELGLVEEEAARCKQVIDDLLDLARPMPVKAGAVDLRALCEDVSQRLLGIASRVPRIFIHGAGSAVADRVRIRQVVFNLLKNAVEAAGPDGEVQVQIGCSEAAAQLSVRDTGPGLTREARARIFEPFFTTKSAGTGLGLAVSRAIARAHGGDIEAANDAEGGAVFRLRLPRGNDRRA